VRSEVRGIVWNLDGFALALAILSVQQRKEIMNT
jgi:hypothetical protein